MTDISCHPCRLMLREERLLRVVDAGTQVIKRLDPARWRDKYRRHLMRQLGFRTLRGRGKRRQQIEKLLLEAERHENPAVRPVRPSAGGRTVLGRILPQHFWLRHYVERFIEHLRKQPDRVEHLERQCVPAWMMRIARLRVVDRALSAGAREWPRRRRSAAIAAIADTIGVSSKTLQRAMRDWEEARAREFATRYATATNIGRQWVAADAGLEPCEANSEGLLLSVREGDDAHHFKLLPGWFCPFVWPEALGPFPSPKGRVLEPPGLTPRQRRKLEREGYTLLPPRDEAP